MPPKLHVVVTARTMPSLRARARWRASSELLEINRAELAFTIDEVESLLGRRLEQPVSRDLARSRRRRNGRLADRAADVERQPRRRQRRGRVDNLLQRIPGPAELLFDYLAEEVFLRQTPDIRRFLAESACLRRLDADACDFALGVDDSATMLRFLEQGSLFVSRDGGYRYHALFADFLHRRSDISAQRREQIHRRAAEFYVGEAESTRKRCITCSPPATTMRPPSCSRESPDGMTATGRHRALARVARPTCRSTCSRGRASCCSRTPRRIDSPADTSKRSPLYARARDRFRDAGDARGEIRTLRAQALVYLDTVQPARAEPLLREALRKSRGDRRERAALYALLAENKLNAGNLRHAERMYRAVHRVLHPGRADRRSTRECICGRVASPRRGS